MKFKNLPRNTLKKKDPSMKKQLAARMARMLMEMHS